MRTFFSLLGTLFTIFCFAQNDTEVFMMNISPNLNGDWSITNFKNVSNNEGYDNQPSFMGKANLLYAGTRDGATDIAVHNIPSGQNWWLNVPTDGGEYSPQPIPSQRAVAAVRLDPDGLQRLYKYPFGEKAPELLFNDLRVAYFAFYDENKVMASVLSSDRLDLVIADIKTQKVDTLLEGSGRSIHRVPNQKSMSYTVENESGNHEIYLYDMDSRESFFVCELPIGIQDYAWLDENRMILGSNAQLYLYDLLGNPNWIKVADLSPYKIVDITRITGNLEENMIAIAGTSSAMKTIEVIDKQVTSFNTQDLDAFASCFAEDVSVRIFPNKELYQTRSTLKRNYKDYYESVTSTGVKVTNRIALNGFVIDAETANDEGNIKNQVAIYQVNNGEIKSMTFIFDQELNFNPETIVDKQLEAYNARDIDAFMATYSNDIELFNYPDIATSKGQGSMKERYGSFFNQTPDLHCEIKNRIVIGNKVIDEEYITMNGTHFRAIAVYEVDENEILKVTFIR